MKNCVFLVVLFFVCAVTAQPQPPQPPQDYTPVCDPGDYTDNVPPLPDFPRQFSFTIEAVLGSFINTTVIVSEYFDDIGNRGRLDSRFNGTDETMIFDYSIPEAFFFPDLRFGGECIALQPEELRFVNRTFGLDIRNGTFHIGSPVKFIEFVRDETAIRFMGNDEVRGIPVQRWQTCTILPNNSYTVDYYFTPRSYNYNGESNNFDDEDDLLPIQFVLNASRIDRNTSFVLSYVHMYNFYNFKSGPESVPDEVFRVPNGLRCRGRSEGPPVPTIPKFFTLYAEIVGNNSFNAGGVGTIREAYDKTHNLFRVDSYYNGSRGGNPGPVSLVHDVEIGVEYAFNRNSLGCSIQPLTASPYGRFDLDFSGSTPQLIGPNRFFFRSNEFNYSYEGVTTVRGMEVDSWISIRDFEQISSDTNATDVLYEIFFTQPGWRVSSDLSQTTDPVPVRLKISGMFTFLNRTDNTTKMSNASFQLDFFDFSTNEPPYDAFDVSTCFGDDDYHYVLLAVPGHREDLDYGLLKTNVRLSISNLTGVRPIQVGNIEIRGDNDTHLFVGARLYNLTRFANVDPRTNVTANRAFDILVNSTANTSQLPFTLTISSNLTVTPSLFHFGRGRNGSCNVTVPMANNTCTKNCTTNITTQLGLTDGIVAGIAIALFFGGMIIGMLVILLCCCMIRWYRSGSVKSINPVKYERHNDELNVD